MRKVILLLSILLLSQIYLPLQAQDREGETQNVSVSESFSGQTLFEIFETLESKHPIQFFFKEEWVTRTKIGATFSDSPLRTVLEKILDDTNLDYVFYGETAVIIGRNYELKKLDAFSFDEYVETVETLDEKKPVISYNLFKVGDSTVRPIPENATIYGSVFNVESDEALPGCKITFPDLEKGAFGDSSGKFEITIPTGTHKATIEAQGHEKVTTLIQAFTNGKLDIPLAYTDYKLDELF